MACIDNSPFHNVPFGKIALEKLSEKEPLHKDFRLYAAGWLKKGTGREVMEVTGAVFRRAKSGPNKGKMVIMVPGTTRTTYVTADEIRAFNKEVNLSCNIRC